MGRANVYLPDDLERRVRAAKIPVSEVCQQALMAAVEAAEAPQPRLEAAVGEQYARGAEAGERWARAASPLTLLALVRDQRLSQIPPEELPPSWYSLTDELSTAWEAGFAAAARAVAHAAVAGAPAPVPGPTPPEAGAPGAPGAPGEPGEPGEPRDAQAEAAPSAEPPSPEASPEQESPLLGDGSTSFIGVDHAGRRIAFDPHAAVADGKSPLFAVLGPADQRAHLALSIGQDAASRGVAVVMLDLSGQLTPQARGLGKTVRVPGTGQQQFPSLDALLGSSGLRGVWDALSGLSTAGGSLFPTIGGPSTDLVTPGYVTVLALSGEGPFGGAVGAMNALKVLAELTTKGGHPQLLLVDLPAGVAVPSQLAAALGRFIRTARQNNVAVGLSAQSADAVADVGGSGALLSTVFAFPTSSPVEADRLRDLLGAHAPILLNPPGFAARAGDELWCTMRDLAGRLGQIRLDAA